MSKAASIEDIFPLSPLQKGLLFHTLYTPGEAVYFEQLTCELHGRLDEAAFAQAWRLLVARHPILRTAFVWKGQSEPRQVVHRTLEMPWLREDWRAFSPEQQNEKLAAFLAADRARGFEPNRAPLMRLATLRLSDTVWQLVWSHHHLLLDGWSFPLLLREFGLAYGALSTGATPALPPARPFGAYLQWLQKRDASRDEQFWREELRGFAVPTPLTVDRPARGGTNYEVIDFALDEADTSRLQQAARDHRVTLSTLCQGAYGLVLSRYASTEDVVFGITVSGRPAELPGVENIVGLFINTLPLRIGVSDSAEAGPWLRALQEKQLGLQEHGHAGLGDIQGWSDVPRGQQLFESLFVFINYPPVDTALANRFGELEPRALHFVERTNYPLTIDVLPGSRLTFRTAFDTDRLDRDTVLRLLGHIRQALLGLGQTNARLGQIELVAGAEKAALLAASTPQAPVEDLRDGCLHAWFARQAATTPDGIAISSESGTLTYAELDRAANALAQKLRAFGVQRGTLVGLFLERDAPLVIGLLGILKAGGAYVPLDPIYPDDRLDYTLEDSAVPVIVTSSELSVRLSNPMVMRVELDASCLHPGPDEDCTPLPIVTESEDPAYVIYTSGSTGRPKGCMVTHRNVLRLFTATEAWYDFNPTDVWTFFHSAAFDFSVWEIWGALLYGGRLVVVPYFTSREPAAFCDLLIREKVTILNQTPSAFRQLIKAEETLPDPRALSLRYVIFGGEALEFASLRSWFERHGDTQPQLVNMYGITETTVFTTYRPLRRADAYEARGSLIGIPIVDTPVLVTDSRGHLSPIGVPGELVIAGVSLAIGYLKRAELTAQRFVPDPFGVSCNGRLYRSGDLARRLPDGDLDYLGRIDDQVKIRGFRIELGEIENVFSTHPSVREVVVLARAESPGAEKRLVAYVVPRGEERITVDVLREHLLTRLPEYMVPTAIVALEQFPLTANGKIDRRALPEPSGQLADVSADYIAPRTDRERTLVEIWSTTLGAERVGVTDSYFALGGDSITGITVCSRAREKGIEFSLQDLFEKQTIEALAAEPAESTSTPATSTPAQAPALAPFALVGAEDRTRLPGGLVDAYPVTRLQAGMLFHSQGAAGSALYHDVFSHHLRGPLDVAALQTELDALVQRHPVLRTGFDVAAFSEPLQLVHAQSTCPLTTGDLSHLSAPAQEEWLDRFVHDEALRAFDWSRPPLLRVHVHRRSVEEFQFTLSLHHAILDGWSVATLLTELFQRYLARGDHGTAPTPPPPAIVGFGDYVALERAALADEITRNFWAETLADAELLELPPAEPALAAKGVANRAIEISPALSAALNRTAEQLGVPLKSVLLAAHLRVLGQLGGSDDVVTGLVTNGRPESAGAEHLTGLFLNAVPFRLSLADAPDWAGLVRATFAAEKALLPHRRLPLAEIQKRQSGAPLFTTDFNFVHFHVYDALRGLGALERLGTRAREETNFTLAVNFGVDPQTGTLGGAAACDRGALDARVIDALPALYLAALEAIAATPAANWRATALRSATAESLLRGETIAFPEAESTLHELFAAQMARTPAAPAVVDDTETLNYAELDRRANQLAHWLRRRGVRPDDRVAVALERSTALVVSLLGVLKAGAAYVPIDPGYPAERIAGMLADCTARVVLAESVNFSSGAVAFRAQWPEIARESDATPALAVDPAQLAYVIFTSGSTGRPKGVAVSHEAIVNHMAWMQREFPLRADDAVLQKTPVSFDASVWEFWAPLLAGARLVMARPGGHHDPAYLAEAVRTQRITTLQLVPSVLEFFLEEAAKAPCPSLRRVFAGGEALSTALRDRCHAVLPGAPLVNLYGPAEATIDATFSVCAPTGPVSLGAPVANVDAFILDARMEPVPAGVAGELYLGGSGLARGYLGRADLSAERFVPHPSQPGARLYRTGDRVRRQSDGTLLYLGRADTQVKIRGHRVEPGEVEAVLATHADVARAAVIARADSTALRLVAYVVLRRRDADLAALREWLRARLPEALVPAVITPLETLPLTPGGKLDRRALPAPAAAAATPTRTASTAAPTTPAERVLKDIWQRTLNVPDVGLQDNFFELGGDSILSLRVVSLAARAGWKLRALQIFEHPTLAALARVATPATKSASLAEVAPGEEIPLTPIQHEFFALNAPNPHHWNQAVFLETRAGLSAAHLAEAWRLVTARHAAFRLRFSRQRGGWRQTLAAADVPPPPFEITELSANEISRRAEDAQQRLNLTDGPVARAVFFEAGTNAAGRLLCVAHHLVVDGVSWRILFEELAQAAEALAASRPVELPAPTISFAAAAKSGKAAASSSTLLAESGYWREVVTAPAAALPLDFPAGRSENREATTATVSIKFTADETDALLRGVPAIARSGIDTALLSALLGAVQGWARADALRVHLEGHGRDDAPDAPDLSRTIGWFTTLCPVRLASAPDADAATRLRSVKETLQAIPRRGLGYGWLRHSGQNTLPASVAAEISFNYLGRLDLALDDGGPFRPASNSPGRERAADTARAHLLDIVAAITAEGLKVDWIFSERAHRRETIEQLGQRFAGEVRALLAQFSAGPAAFAIPADFPLAALSRGELTRVLARGEIEDIWPLAPLQEGMLVHALHEGVAGMYAQQLAFELRGEPDADALARAWLTAAQRHAALRLEFVWEELPAPRQLVRRDISVPLTTHDWSALTEAERESRWDAWLAEDRRQGFALESAPLWRVTLFKLAPARWRLVWTHHHLLLDGWSLPLVFRDVLAAYAGRNAAQAPAASYRDYLAWLRGRSPDAAAAFWKKYLVGYATPAALAIGPAPMGARAQSAAHRSARAALPASATVALKQFAQRHELTLGTCAQAAWAFVLARHLGVDESVFGLVVSGRPPEVAGVESIVGLFINTLPLRVPVPRSEHTSVWLRNLQSKAAALREFESSRLVDIQGWSEVPRGQALFESALVFENYPVDAAITAPVAGLELGAVESFEHTNFPLTLYVLPGDDLALRLDYAESRFTDESMHALATQVAEVLGSFAAAADRPVASLALQPATVARAESARWNDTARSPWDRTSVQQRFGAQAQRTPSAPAVVADSSTLSFAALDARSNQLAHLLRARGAAPGRLVGVCLERSPEMVVALLAILKTGAAYVPLDPAFPPARLAMMREDSGLTLAVTDAAGAALPGLFPAGVTCVRVDADAAEIARESVTFFAHESAADELAYVIFTSGSTGRPKGVQVTHGGLANFLSHFAISPGLTASDTLVAVTTLSFDIAALELFLPLVTGAKLVLARREVAADARALATTLATQQATVMQATPATWRLLLADDWRPAQRLRVWCGGEAMPRDLAAALLARGCEVTNLYGPTETTIWSAAQPVATPDDALSIGRPIAHTSLLILDAGLNPLPIGVAGELFIGGEGVARGYHGRPDLTAERFIPDPFGPPGARMYATGDLARRLPDGRIEFLGRIDQQVKLRGFRIELGEIETALRAHPAVQAAAVAIRDDAAGEKRLVAYVVGAADLAGSGLREHLRARLPDYMVPTAFVPLAALPLTPNGKLDRRALPAPEGLAATRDDYVAPRDAVEQVLADLWCEVLRAERVGIHDNFFDLGGHSLLAAQALARIRKIFQVELPLRVFFETATPEKVAVALAAADIAPGRVAKTAAALLRIRAMTPAERAAALERRKSGAPAATP
jgi:amino acid adenylation domain-containing protein/non-ribosomal peptide synthase protein (TIGR01720 family)